MTALAVGSLQAARTNVFTISNESNDCNIRGISQLRLIIQLLRSTQFSSVLQSVLASFSLLLWFRDVSSGNNCTRETCPAYLAKTSQELKLATSWWSESSVYLLFRTWLRKEREMSPISVMMKLCFCRNILYIILFLVFGATSGTKGEELIDLWRPPPSIWSVMLFVQQSLVGVDGCVEKLNDLDTWNFLFSYQLSFLTFAKPLFF